MQHSLQLRRQLSMLAACGAVCLGYAPTASADDGGADAATVADGGDLSDAGPADPDGGSAGDGSTDDAGGGSAPTGLQGTSCDGALCDTTNGSELGGSCAVGMSRTHPSFAAWLFAGGLLAIGLGTRRRATAVESTRHGR